MMRLCSPDKLWSREEVLEKPSPVPKRPGVYGWFFKEMPPNVPVDSCVTTEGLTLLYVGIAPKAPPLNGAPSSRESLLTRIRYHYTGNAEGSTLRLTLGCLLADVLGIKLRRVGSGKRLTFADGEAALSAWMGQNAFVSWLQHDEPWKLEEEMIINFSLPLNLAQNKHHPFCQSLSLIRREARLQARALPIWTAIQAAAPPNNPPPVSMERRRRG